MVEEIYDVAIIGGGPAGMSAAIYAGRAHLKTVILEALAAGGQMFNTSTIENYPGLGTVDGPELSQQMMEQVQRWGAQLVSAQVVGIRREGHLFSLSDVGGNAHRAHTVIVATGSKPRKLEVPGEARLAGSGVSYCATCDGAFFRDKHVAMIGGGDSAVEESLYLARIVQKVTVIHRRGELRATKDLQERAFREPRIEFLWDSAVAEILGQLAVEGVRVNNRRTGAVSVLPVAGVFIYIGTLPNTEFLHGLVPLDEAGYIRAGEDTVTDVPGLFAAGDVRTKSLRQIVTALGDGAVAAMAAERYLARAGL